MLQFSIVGLKTKELYLPTRIQKIIVDPIKHSEIIESLPESSRKCLCSIVLFVDVLCMNLEFYHVNIFLAIPINMYRDIDVIKSGGIELCGLKLSLAPRRQQSQAAPKLEKYTFVPYTADKVIYSDLYYRELIVVISV